MATLNYESDKRKISLLIDLANLDDMVRLPDAVLPDSGHSNTYLGQSLISLSILQAKLIKLMHDSQRQVEHSWSFPRSPGRQCSQPRRQS
jgi:hypothetical protein